MILFVRRLLEIAGGVVRRGVRAGLCGLPDELGCQRPSRLRGQGRLVHDRQRTGPAGELAGDRDSSNGVPFVASLEGFPTRM